MMTLEQVRDKLRQYDADSVEHYNKTGECLELTIAEELADAIDAHFTPREVSDEDVERAWIAFVTSCGILDDGTFDAHRDDIRAALQADRQCGG